MKSVTAPAVSSAFKYRVKPIRVAEISFLIFFAVAMGLPLLFLLSGSFNLAAPGKAATYGFDNWIRAFSDGGTLGALWMSFLLSVVRLIPAMIIAVIFAWLIARTDMPCGNAVESFCWIAYFVPDFPLTLAWILLLDPNFGFLNTLAKGLPWVDGVLFNPYSFWGIVWVHTSTGGIWFKVMLLVPIFRRLGAAFEEAARISGAGTGIMLRRITLPLLSPMILAVSVLSFIRGLQSFNTELLLGTPAKIYVYSTRIYDYLQQEPRAYGEATALGSVFLIVLAVLLFFYWKYLSGGRKFTVVTGQGYSTMRVKLGKWRYVALGGCVLYIAVMMILPLLFLVIGSFMRRYGFFNIASPFTLAHWQNLFADPLFLEALRNSLIIASATAAGGIMLYAGVAYLLVSRRTVTAPFLESFCWIPHVLPGILLSLGVLWLFLSTPLRWFLYGTVWGIALALILADSPVTTQAFKAGFLQLGSDLEEAARVSGASWSYTYRRILLPLLAPIAAAVGLMNFGSALTSISTPVLLYSHQSRPLAILLLEYSFTGELERAAALGLSMTMIIACMMLVARKFGLRLSRSD
ncbi:MAG TPA: iron ABC transporter permease [Candidatus Binatia bacterium]|jgi:iron(III) transport system permease protein|nr:iron ABC transporter permease [Candidatus Binatia bacterium]